MKAHFLGAAARLHNKRSLVPLSFCNLLQKCLSVCSHEHYSAINFVRNLYCSASWPWSLTRLVSRRCHQSVKVTKKKQTFQDCFLWNLISESDNLGFELSQFWLWYYAEMWTLNACMCQNHRIPQLKSNCRSSLFLMAILNLETQMILNLEEVFLLL